VISMSDKLKKFRKNRSYDDDMKRVKPKSVKPRVEDYYLDEDDEFFLDSVVRNDNRLRRHQSRI
jgi:hypothetical protein